MISLNPYMDCEIGAWVGVILSQDEKRQLRWLGDLTKLSGVKSQMKVGL